MRLLVAMILQLTNDLPMEVPRLVSLSAKQHAKYVKIARCQVQAGFPVYPFYIYIYIPLTHHKNRWIYHHVQSHIFFKTQRNTLNRQPVRDRGTSGRIPPGRPAGRGAKTGRRFPTVGYPPIKRPTKTIQSQQKNVNHL